MRVRHLLSEVKTPIEDSGNWSKSDLPPRWCSIYPRSKPTRAGWQWRSVRAKAGEKEYLAVARCNPMRDNWQALLILESRSGPSVIARYEYHGSHPGKHVHSDCNRSGLEIGASSMDNLARFPNASSFHRRIEALTPASFWRSAKDFFRIASQSGEQNELF